MDTIATFLKRRGLVDPLSTAEDRATQTSNGILSQHPDGGAKSPLADRPGALTRPWREDREEVQESLAPPF